MPSWTLIVFHFNRSDVFGDHLLDPIHPHILDHAGNFASKPNMKPLCELPCFLFMYSVLNSPPCGETADTFNYKLPVRPRIQPWCSGIRMRPMCTELNRDRRQSFVGRPIDCLYNVVADCVVNLIENATFWKLEVLFERVDVRLHTFDQGLPFTQGLCLFLRNPFPCDWLHFLEHAERVKTDRSGVRIWTASKMNIFFLSFDARKAAEHHCDKHVVKMILETAQLLYSAHWSQARLSLPQNAYKKTHVNHPCAIWTRESGANYRWLCELGLALCDEFTFRYGGVHRTRAHLLWLAANPPPLPEVGVTEIRQAMPDEYKRPNVVEAYRTYYRENKLKLRGIVSYSKRPPPKFLS